MVGMVFSANDPDPATATWTGKRLFDSRVTLCAGLAQESALEVLASCVVDVWALLLVDVGAGVLICVVLVNVVLVVVVVVAVATVLGAFDTIFVVVLRSFGEAVEVNFFIRPVVMTELLEVDRFRVSHPLHVLSHSSTNSPHKPLPRIR